MPILNFTTAVPVSRSVAEVTKLLVKGGATSIMSRYADDGAITGLSFTVATDLGPRAFQLPVNADSVTQALVRDPRVPRRSKTSAQGERVAWRILKDWIEAQLAIIEAGMVKLDEVMLPYMVDNGVTVYELYRTQAPAIEG